MILWSMFFQPKTPEVICIGSCSQDIFFPSDEYVIYDTPEDITSKQKAAFEVGGKFRVPDRYEAIGGVAANTSIGLARLGVVSACYTHIGRDGLGDWAMGELAKESVLTHLVQREAGIRTDLSAVVVLAKSGDRIIFHNRDANERLVVEQVKLAKTDWIFMSALNGDWKTNVATVLAHLNTSSTRLALNPGQHNLKENPELVLSLIARADVVVLNKDEAIELLMHGNEGQDSARLDDERFLLEALIAKGVRCVGLTDGMRGAWATDGTDFLFAPIHTLGAVVDSTGAGDAFTSGFLAGRIRGLPLQTLLAMGMLNSGGVVTRYGAVAGLQTQANCEELLQDVMVRPL